jgi:hypothetical protein
MEKVMKMERLNAWLGLAGHVAVLLGLIALAVEINGNTKALHVQVMENTASRAQEGLLAVAGNVDLQTLYVKALLEPAELTPSEFWGAVLYFEERIVEVQRKYDLLKSGVLSEEEWRRALSSVPYQFGTTFGRFYWSEVKEDGFDPDFVVAVDSAIANFDGETNENWLRRVHKEMVDSGL